MRPRPGARTRSTVAATGVVAVALVLGMAALLWTLNNSLTQGVRTSAEQRASDVSALVATDGAGKDTLLPRSASERSVVQIINLSGAVLAASPEIDGEAALTSLRPKPGSTVSSTASLPVGDQELFVIVATGVHTAAGDLVVITAESLVSVERGVHTVGLLLLAGFPLVLLVVAGSVFYFVGRTLRPVEDIRSRVASITASGLGSRVPVPAADDEVSRLASTMNGMLDRLQAAQAAQQRFVADASHELRSPLAALRATVEVARDHPETASWNDAVDGALAEADRLERLVDDLLLLARTDERGLGGERRDVDLDDIVAQERDRLRSIGRIRVTAQISTVRVVGDRRQLERLVRNLCDNAACVASSTVGLELRVHRGEAVIVVADDGPGVPEIDRRRVFDRFVRLDSARGRTSGGSGLGLAIVSEVASAHGGSVCIEDGGPGARLVVRLPITSRE